MIKLSVNLNKIALIRNSREGDYPSVVAHAERCIAAGAQGITVHPRPDQRHIRPGDVHDLARVVEQHAPKQGGVEYNIEGNPFAEATGSYPGFMALVADTLPHQATLVPDANDQLTSDHGFDLIHSGNRLEPVIRQLRDLGVRVSLFMDPDPEQIKLAKEVGAHRIELYTGPYALAYAQNQQLDTLHQRYQDAAALAVEIGLGVNAGHDLNLHNLVRFRTIPGLQEVSIGHAFTVDSLAMGMDNAVRAYLAVLSEGTASMDNRL